MKLYSLKKQLKYIISALLFFSHIQLLAIENYPVGARSAGMANASVILNDVWSIHHNQAGLAFLQRPVAGFFFENRFAIQELSLTSFALGYPVWNGVAGFNLTYWGFEKFNTTKFGIAFSKKLGDKISAGIQLDYFNTYLSEEYGNKGSLLAELGIRVEPISNFIIAAHFYNLTRVKFIDYNDERLPTIFRLGMGYNFSDKLLVSLENEKNLTDEMIIKIGFEYKFDERFYIRAGIASEPILNTFGFGYLFKNLSINMAFSRHQILGLIPHFSVDYKF